MQCRIRVNDAFCAVSLSGTMRSGMSVQLEKNRLGDLLDARALGCRLDGEKFLCGADNSGGENTSKHLGFEENEDVLHGFGVLCVNVRKCAMWKNLLFGHEFERSVLGLPSSYNDS